MSALSKCRTCDGTGTVFLMNSWFIRDGLCRSRCGICSGTGLSDYQPAPGIIKRNREFADLSKTSEPRS